MMTIKKILIAGLFVTIVSVYAEQEQGMQQKNHNEACEKSQPAVIVSNDELHSKTGWEYIHYSLLHEVCNHSWNRMRAAGDFINKHKIATSVLLASLVGVFPPKLFPESFVAAGLGLSDQQRMVIMLEKRRLEPCIVFAASFFTPTLIRYLDKTYNFDRYKKAFISFVSHYKDNRDRVPSCLHELFDALADEYAYDKKLACITKQQAAQLINGLLLISESQISQTHKA